MHSFRHPFATITSTAAVISLLSSCVLFSPNRLDNWSSPEEVESGKAKFLSDTTTLEQQAEIYTASSSLAPSSSSSSSSSHYSSSETPVVTTEASSETATSSDEPLPPPPQRQIRIALGDPSNTVPIILPAGSRWWIGGANQEPNESISPISNRAIEQEIQIIACERKMLCLTSPSLGKITLAETVRIAPPPEQWLTVKGKKHRGELLLKRSEKSVQPIIQLQLEDYLRGVVPLEIGKLDTTRFEALKAQAVAARTYTIRHLGQRASAGFDLFDDTRDQVYGGISAEDSLVTRAIQETAGLVMTWNGEPIESYYHSTCGGMTASLHEVWGKEKLPYLSSQPDLNSNGQPWCAGSAYLNWEFHWSWEQLDQMARNYLSTARPNPEISVQRVERLQVLSYFPDGRVNQLELIGEKGKRTIISGDKTRWLLRDPAQPQKILPSARFKLEAWGTKGVTAKGSGYGHGIGLCQMGARERARQGETFREILSAYYPGTVIETWKDETASTP